MITNTHAMISITPSTIPAVASPEPFTIPLDELISSFAFRPRLIATMPRIMPRQTKPKIPQTSDQTALLEVVAPGCALTAIFLSLGSKMVLQNRHCTALVGIISPHIGQGFRGTAVSVAALPGTPASGASGASGISSSSGGGG